MKTATIGCVVLSSVLSVTAQNWTWAETAGGILPDEAGGCVMDNAGNMYMSGFYFSSSINFGHGSSLSNDGLSDGFIVKYNASGQAQWSSKVKGSREDKATRCAVDKAGNVFVTGYFDSPSIQFGGNNSHNVSNFDGSGNTFDCFIVKYNTTGTPQWFRAIGKADDDGGNSVAADSSGNVYVTGWFRAVSITVGGFTLHNSNPSGGTSDMFLIKYDPNGNVLWAKSAGGADDDKGNACIVDPSGNVIVTGYFKAPSITIEGTVYPGNGSKDAFVIKYTANGGLVAAKVFGGSSGEEPFACSVDAAGNVFVAGNFGSGSVMFDAITLANTGNGFGAFLVKLNASLDAQWVRGASSDSDDEARGCATDSYGNTVVTGVFSGNSITFGATALHNNGGDEIFLAKYDPQGNLFWAKKAGKSRDDGANDCFIGNNGKIIIAGYYNSSSLTFGNIDLDNSYVGVATSDVFIASTCNAAMGVDAQTACNTFTWIDGNAYTSNNNIAVFNFPAGSVNGCDSAVTLNLTINTADASLTDQTPALMANATGAAYRWLDCDHNFAHLPGETAQSFTPTTSGNYAVEVTENGCTDTSSCIAVNGISVSIPENSFQGRLKIYPNPTDGRLWVEWAAPCGQANLTVRNMLGQAIYSENYSNVKRMLLDLAGEEGVYFLEMRTGSYPLEVVKVVKR